MDFDRRTILAGMAGTGVAACAGGGTTRVAANGRPAGLVGGAGVSSQPPHPLSNRDAGPEARDLYAFLWSIWHRYTLTGQQEQNFTPAGPRTELDHIRKVTGGSRRCWGSTISHPKTSRT